MSWAFAPERGPRANVRRVAFRQVEKALESLARPGPPHAHEPRRCVKRLRALVRLCRHALPDQQREGLDRELRIVGRALGGLRDAEALPQTLAGLALPAATLAPLQQQAHAALDAVRDAAQPSLLVAISVLHGVDDRLRDLALEGGWTALLRGLGHAFGRGRRARVGLDVAVDSDAFHRLRKRVKDVHCQARLFAAGGGAITALIDATGELGDRLGEERDLALLEARLASGWGGLAGDDRRDVVAAVAARRLLLRAEALALAEHVFAERRRDIVGRVRAHWRDARRQTAPA
ncbi:MAG TPA: CHAD domain-containing protein [Planctomycetota bacterium]|nr:CHAD domain-containing protein [Planctomycetota bacterium]